MTSPEDDRVFRRALGALMLLYVLLVTWAQSVKYESLRMGFDIALYEQITWNTAHGRWFETSIFKYTTSTLGQDVTLLHALVAVPYRIFPSSYTLLLLETAAVALGALPLYLLSRRKLGRGPGLALAFAYLVYVPLHHLNLYEYQPRAFALGLAFAMFHCLETGSLRGFVLSALLMLTSRIDTSLTVAAFGIYALLKRKPKAFGLTALVLGAGWFVIVMYFITPRFNTMGRLQYLDWYGYLGQTPGEILTTIVTRPLFVIESVLTSGKLAFLAKVYGESLFLPFLRPDVLLLSAPSLGLCLLSPRQIQWDIRYQYAAMLYPLAFLGTVAGVATLSAWGPLARRFGTPALVRFLVGAVVAGNLAAHVLVGSPVWFWLHQAPPPYAEKAQQLAARIPPEAAVAASSQLGPRVSRRRRLYFFPPNNEFYSDQALSLADYVLTDARSDAGDPAYETLKHDPGWVLEAKEGRFRLFRRATAEERARREASGAAEGPAEGEELPEVDDGVPQPPDS